MHLSSYLGLLETGCATLAKSYRQVADGHADEADVKRICQQFAAQCDHQEEQLQPFTDRYGYTPRVNRSDCTLTAWLKPAAADWACCAICMICICWLAIWTWRGCWWIKPPKVLVTRSSSTLWRPAPN